VKFTVLLPAELRGCALRLLDLRDQGRGHRRRAARRARGHRGRGPAHALPVQHRHREALVLLALRHLHPPPAPLGPEHLRRQRRLPRASTRTTTFPTSRSSTASIIRATPASMRLAGG
jgi:hypothetical protein